MNPNETPKYNVRRELVKLECQNCGANLEIVDETYAYCKYCGQRYIINELLERIPDAQEEKEKQVAKAQPTKTQPAKLQSSKENCTNAFGTIGFIMMLAVMIFCVFLIFKGQEEPNRPGSDNTYVDIGVGKGSNKNDTSTKGDAIEKWDGFRSETMKQVVYIIFGKPVEEVTKEELESVKYFKLDTYFRETCTISYSTEDYREHEPDYQEKLPDYNGSVLFGYNRAFEETIQKITLLYPSESFELINGDIRNFTNLTAISLSDYRGMDFSTMPHLTMVDCDSDLKDLLETNLPVEQIETLRISRCDLTGLTKFKSLKHLFLEGIEENNMDELVKCTTLETLFCNYCFGTASYAPLGQLTGLKSLYIDGGYNAVKDLSMISAFTELENLSITCTDILNIGFVKDLKKLKTLRLSENGELRDFTGIGTLQELEFLELNINSLSGGQPEYAEIGELKNLKSLALHTVYNLDFLYELKQLEKLEVRLTFYDDVLLPIAQMKNLKELTLAQTNTWSMDMEHFKGLQELPQLKKLTIDKMDFEDPVDELFAIDGLEELEITSCGFEVPPAKITVSDKLKVLDLSGTYFGDYYNGGPQEEQEVLEHYCRATTLEKLDLTYYDVTDVAVFENMSNLKELSLRYCELTDIPETTFRGCDSLERLDISNNQIADLSFVKNLPNLMFLEMREGYVADLSPLLDCTQLKCVDVRANPIAENPLTNVAVITE